MKRFNQFLNAMPRQLRDAFEACSRLKCMELRQHDSNGGNGIFIPPMTLEDITRCRPATLSVGRWVEFVALQLRRAYGGQPEHLVSLWAWAGLWSQGIRAYQPTREEFVALSQVEIRIPWNEYRQPYETFCVVVPDGIFAERISGDVGAPIVCVCRYNTARRVVSFVLGALLDGQLCPDLYGGHWWRECQSEEPIETYLKNLPDSHTLEAPETDAVEVAKRAAINANLLLTHYGAKRLGSANPEYEAKLTASLAKKKLPESVRRANEAALKALPVLYGFDQHVKVYETEGTGDPAGGGGWHVKPHWRRGHWAMLACGAGRKERRRVFRAAVMVHADRFGGAPADTRVTLTTDGGAAA